VDIVCGNQVSVDSPREVAGPVLDISVIFKWGFRSFPFIIVTDRVNKQDFTKYDSGSQSLVPKLGLLKSLNWRH
jgi:hypothetical protein